MRNVIEIIALLCGLPPALAGCGGTESHARTLTAPSAGPSAPADLHIATITPTAVSTLGGAWGQITGTGFRSGVQVTFGGAAPHQIWLSDPNTIQFWTSAHESGTVDVVVRNPGGGQDTLRQGFTFAPSESFDFNGTWVGYAGDDYSTEMSFVVENNALTRVSCGASPQWTFATPVPVVRGEFNLTREDGLSISGQIVSATNAIGNISVAPCATNWWADKQGSTRQRAHR